MILLDFCWHTPEFYNDTVLYALPFCSLCLTEYEWAFNKKKSELCIYLFEFAFNIRTASVLCSLWANNNKNEKEKKM